MTDAESVCCLAFIEEVLGSGADDDVERGKSSRGNLPPTVRQRRRHPVRHAGAAAVAGVIVRAVEEEGELASFRRMGRVKK